MIIARKIAYNVLVSSISKIAATVIALISIGFITRYLGKDGFGNYATVLAFLSFFAAIADLGLYHISTREISRADADEKKIIGNIFSLRIISSSLIFLISPAIAYFFPYAPEVKRGIIIVAASFIFSSGYQVLNGIFQKNLAMDKVVLTELVGKIIQLLFIIMAVKLNLGFDWIMASLLAYMIFSFFVVWLWSRKYLKFSLQINWKYWKDFLKESMPMGVVAIITFFYFKMDTIILSVFKESADVGIYNAAYKVIENITFFPAMVSGLILPIISRNIFSDKDKFKEVANKNFKFFIIMVVPIVIGAIFLAEGIISIIGGAGFIESALVLKILIFALACVFFGHFFNSILIAGNLQKKLMQILSLAAIINVSLNLVFIPKFSYLAAAATSVVTEFLVVALTFYLVVKNLNYIPKIDNKSGIFLSGVVMTIFLWVFPGLNFFIRALVSAAFYFVSLWIFKAVKTSELTSLISQKSVEEYEELP